MAPISKHSVSSSFVKSTLAIAITSTFVPSALADTTNLTDSSVDSTTNGAVVSADNTSVTVLNGQTIINWNAFGLASSESIDFTNTEGTMAGTVVLNRVIGADSSLIDGTISTTDIETLIFANANGITIGDNFVNTGAGTSNLMFSTKDISSLSGYSVSGDNFGLTLGTDNDANLIINGTISTIEPADYKLTLVSGGDVTFGASGDDGDQIATSFLSITADGAVDGSNGLLDVDGEVSVRASGDVVINSIKSAPLYIDTDGDITIDQQEDVLEIGQLEGANVTLTASQEIVAGSVEINLPITATTDSQTATNTAFSSDENIITDGTITINSNSIASNNLEFGASGNLISINSSGGTITTTGSTIGNLYVEVDGSLNIGDVTTNDDVQISEQSGATASLTQTGTITLNSSSDSALDFSGADVADLSVTKAGGNLTINANDISLGGALDVTGNTLIIDATGTITGTAGNDVTANKLTIEGGASSGAIETTVSELELTQADSLSITNTGDLSLDTSNISGNVSVTVDAGSDITVSNSVDIGSAASLSLNAGDATSIVTIGAAVTGDGGTLSLMSDNINVNATVDASTTNIETFTANGSIDLENATDDSATLELNATSISNLFSDNVGIDRTVNIGASGSTGAVTVSEGASNSNATATFNGGAVSITAANTLDNMNIVSSSTVSVTGKVTANDLSVVSSGDVTLTTAVSTLDVDAGAGDITVTEDDDITLQDVTTTSANTTALSVTATAGSISSEASTALAVNSGEVALSSSGNIDVNVSGATTFNSLSENGSLSLTSDASSITLGNDVGGDGTLTLTGLNVSNASSLDTGDDDITVSGDVDLSVTGALTVAGALSSSGAVTLSGGNVSLATVTSDSDASGGDGDVVIEAGTGLALNGNVTTNNNDITIRGNSDSVTLDFGTAGSGNVSVDQTELDRLQAGTGTLTFGSATGGAVSLDGVDLNTTTTQAGVSILTAGALTTDNALNIGGDDLTITADSIAETGSTVITANNVALTVTNAADLGGNNVISGSLSGSAGDLTANNSQALDFGAITAASLSSTVAGAVTDSGSLSISGTTNIDTSGSNGAITLDDDGNSLMGAVTVAAGTGNVTLDNNTTDLGLVVTSGNDVTVENAGMVDLQGTIGNDLVVTSSTGVTDSGSVSVAGTTNLTTTGDGSVVLDDDGNAFTGAVTVSLGNGNLTIDNNTTALGLVSTGAGTVTVEDAGALTVEGSMANLVVTDADSVDDSATLTITGTTDIDTSAGNGAITLDDAANALTGTVTVSSGSGNVTLDNNTTALDLVSTSTGTVTVVDAGAVTVSGSMGSFVVTDADSVDDSGTVTVTGATTIDTSAGNGAITLDDDANNLGGTVTVTSGSGAVTLDNATNALDVVSTSTGAITLENAGALTVAGSMGSLMVSNAASVDDSATLTITGTTDIDTSASNGAVILDDDANSLGGTVTVTSGSGDITVDNNTNALDLVTTSTGNVMVEDAGALTLAGTMTNLTVTNATSVADSAMLDVAGTTNIDTSASNGDITLDQDDNDLTGTVTINAGTGDVTIDNNTTDLALVSTAADAVTVQNASAVSVEGSMGSFTVSSAASVNDSSTLTVTGATNITTTDGTVMLDDDANNLTGTVTVNSGTGDITVDNNTNALSLVSTSTGAVTIEDAGALSVEGSMGSFAVTNATSVTDSGSLTISGSTSIDTSASNGAITLDDDGNALTGTVTVAAGTGNVTLDNNSTDLGLVVTSGNDVTVENAAMLDLQGAVANNLVVSSSTGVTDSGTVTVGGTTNITTTGDGSVVLDSDANAFTGAMTFNLGSGDLTIDNNTTALSLVSTSSGTVTVEDAGALMVEGSMANLAVTDADSVDDSATLTVTGNTTIDTSAGNGTVSLDDTSNSLAGTVMISSGSGAITVDNNTTALDLVTNSSGTVTVTDAGALTVAGSMGSFVVTDADSVDDSATLTVTGATTIDTSAGNGSIMLDDDANSLGGTVTVTSGSGGITLDNATNALDVVSTSSGAVTIENSGALTAAGSMGSLMVSNATSVNDSATLTITGTTDIDTSASNGAVTLDDDANSLGGTVMVNAGTGNLTVDNGTTDLSLAVTSATDVTVENAAAVSLGSSAIAGNLVINSDGNISQTAAISVSGTTTIDADSDDDADNSVTLTDASNDFMSTVSIDDGSSVSVSDANDLEIGTTNASTSLALVAGGAISDSGNIITPTLSFDAGDTVTLNTLDIATLADSQSGGNVTITTNGTSNAGLTVNDIVVMTDAMDVENGDETSSTVSITDTSGSMTVAGSIKGSDGTDDLYLSNIALSVGNTDENYILSSQAQDNSEFLKSKSFDFTSHGNLGSASSSMFVDWKASSASSSNDIDISLGDLDDTDLNGDGDGTTGENDDSGVYLATTDGSNGSGTSYQIVTDDFTGPSRKVALSFSTTETSTTSTLVSGGDLSGNKLAMNLYNRNTFDYVNNQIDAILEVIGQGFDSTNTIAAFISYIVNGSEGIEGFVGFDSNVISGSSVTTSDFFSSGNSLYSTDLKFDLLANFTDSDMDDVLDTAELLNSVNLETGGAAGTVSGDVATNSTSITTLQADVDQNESDADTAIAAVQADVDQNESDADTAIAAVQADVDQNESDADTAIAAVQADVDQNESDADMAVASNATAIAANSSAIDAEVARAVAAEAVNATNIAANASNIMVNTDAITAEAARAMAAESMNADSAAMANAKADALATYTDADGNMATAADGSDIAAAALKAVDGSNLRAGQDATNLGDELDALQQDVESGNGFLDFFRKLFGSDSNQEQGSGDSDGGNNNG